MRPHTRTYESLSYEKQLEREFEHAGPVQAQEKRNDVKNIRNKERKSSPQQQQQQFLFYMYICIYVYVCVCICLFSLYILHIYICMYVHVFMCK